jgi:hypothetical protein
VSYSVDFVEGVGEVGYARRHPTTLLEGDEWTGISLPISGWI